MSISENLRKHFENTSKEELDREWEELKHWNEIGPTFEEYFAWLKETGLYPKKNVKDKFSLP